MEEGNSIFATAVSIVGAALANFYSHLAPWLLLGAVLVAVDLRFGIKAARRRGERIRTSRAWRRTINKSVDYLCWVTLAEVCSRTFGVSLGAPVVSLAMLFIIYGIEISSCVNNYLEYKGTRKRFNFFRLVGKEHLLEEEAPEEEAPEEDKRSEIED